MSRFDSVYFDGTADEKQQIFKEWFNDMEQCIDRELPGPYSIAAKTKAMNHLEIALMWLGKAIRDEQLGERNG